jgi:small subunit ribosomal protein S20
MLLGKDARVGHGRVSIVGLFVPSRRVLFRGASDGVNGLPGASGTIPRPAQRAFLRMPNIKQQKKRVRIAAQERLENLRYRSTVKTLTRRLEAAVEDGDTARVAEEHRQLQRWIDKAVTRGALHRNAGARKKAQAARLAGGSRS